jgi:hypothetical protein
LRSSFASQVPACGKKAVACRGARVYFVDETSACLLPRLGLAADTMGGRLLNSTGPVKQAVN